MELVGLVLELQKLEVDLLITLESLAIALACRTASEYQEMAE